MKYIVCIFRLMMPVLLAGMMLVGAVSCSKDEPSEESHNARCVLVYISGQNNLRPNIDNDIIEMLEGKSGMGENDHLLVFVDDNNKSRIYEINRTTNAKTQAGLTPVYQFSENLNSASPTVLDQVLDYFFKHYEAQDYGLVLWSHGSGWINASSESPQRRSFAVDTSSDGTTRMMIPEMASVLSKYPKFEYILFDACFMQAIEVIYELRAAAKYIIGSPAEMPGPGAPYHKVVPALFLHESEHKIAEAIVNAYGSYYNSTLSSSGGVVLSAARTDDTLDNFVSVMAEMFEKYSFLDETKYVNCLNYFHYDWNIWSAYDTPDFYDIQGIMKAVVTDSDDYARWEDAFYHLSPVATIGTNWYSGYTSALMPVNKSQCGAVSMFLPLEKYKNDSYFDYYKETQWGKRFDIK
ncbi:MAG: hypothetical protein J5720_08370 [Bacteroidaceae bacterium]|nr:hypothetical protein [Bacteroidaceae bacterium]